LPAFHYLEIPSAEGCSQKDHFGCVAVRGVQKPADADWPGAPMCRVCLAESIARTTGQPTIIPSPEFAAAPTTLQ
jgi:hypothetical protein